MDTADVSTNIWNSIAAENGRFMDAFRQRDAAGMAALYTESGQLLPPNAGTMTGREAIQAFWQAVMDMGVQEAQLDIDEVLAYGDTAVEKSRFVLYGAERQVLDQGKYIVVWQQESGQWKMHRDIFNSSLPPAGT